MTDIVEVVEEEFDDEGNLVRRTTTKYGQVPFKFARGGPITSPTDTKETIFDLPGGIRPAVTWPYPGMAGQITVTDPNQYVVWNQQYESYNKDYDASSFARRVAGGTDKDRHGAVVG